jgi:hypothetical protein
MKISAAMAMWMCAVFAVVCFTVAYDGFSSLAGVADAAEREMSVGYAWFWAFLGAIATVFGVLSWMIKTGRLGDSD